MQQIRVLRVLSSLTLRVSRDGASTTSLVKAATALQDYRDFSGRRNKKLYPEKHEQTCSFCNLHLSYFPFFSLIRPTFALHQGFTSFSSYFFLTPPSHYLCHLGPVNQFPFSWLSVYLQSIQLGFVLTSPIPFRSSSLFNIFLTPFGCPLSSLLLHILAVLAWYLPASTQVIFFFSFTLYFPSNSSKVACFKVFSL